MPPAAGRWSVTALVFMKQSGGARLSHWASFRPRNYLQLENGFGVYDSTLGKDADCATVGLLRPSLELGQRVPECRCRWTLQARHLLMSVGELDADHRHRWPLRRCWTPSSLWNRTCAPLSWLAIRWLRRCLAVRLATQSSLGDEPTRTHREPRRVHGQNSNTI